MTRTGKLATASTAITVSFNSRPRRTGARRLQPPRPDRHASVDQVARGRLPFVSIGGCNDCHTPMKFDPELGMPVPT
jgi:hypothetical protein